MSDFTARVVDSDASKNNKHLFKASSSASVATSVSNSSAKGVARVRGLFGKIRGGHKGGHADSKAAEVAAAGSSDEQFGTSLSAANKEYEPELFAEIREGWVRRHMLARAADYTSLEPVAVTVLTWNVAAKKPPSDADMTTLLGPLCAGCSLLVVGLQEAVELSAANVGATLASWHGWGCRGGTRSA